MATQHAVLNDNVQELAILVEETTRSTKDAVKYFLEPAAGTLDRAKSKRHHIVFGRRGSGKSSLLAKIYADHLLSRTPCALVDLEEFKEHSYPDVLVSVLIKTLSEFKKWLDTPAVAPVSKKSFWDRVSVRIPISRKIETSVAAQLSSELQSEIDALNRLLFSPEEYEREVRQQYSQSQKVAASVEGGVDAPGASLKSTLEGQLENGSSRESIDHYKSTKVQALQRGIIRYKSLLNRISESAKSDSYLLLDDLYHLRRSDQASIIDYFHKLAKGTSLWLKVGTIRHRTTWYRHGNPPIGMKLGDDAEQIDLDVTLEKYQTTKSFLMRIIEQLARDKSVTLSDILADGARDRLVLASGGVARDFLTLFRRALEETRERVLNDELTRGPKIGAEDVNRAAGSYYEHKTEELNRDADSGEREKILEFVEGVRNFCLTKTEPKNCFLVEKDFDAETEDLVGELVDLKFAHHAKSRVTVRNREGRIYDAFMLDMSFYTGERTRRGIEVIEFWRSDNADALRKAGLIFAERATE